MPLTPQTSIPTTLVESGSSYQVGGYNQVILVNKTSASPTTILLPLGYKDLNIIVKDDKGDANTNNITITPSGSDLIDGQSSYVINMAFSSVNLIFNKNWSHI